MTQIRRGTKKNTLSVEFINISTSSEFLHEVKHFESSKPLQIYDHKTHLQHTILHSNIYFTNIHVTVNSSLQAMDSLQMLVVQAEQLGPVSPLRKLH